MKKKLIKTINYYLDSLFGVRLTYGYSRRPSGIEDEAWEILRIAQGRTMGTALQQYTMWLCTKYVSENKLEGSIVEFGVWRGGMSLIAANTLSQVDDLRRELYLFDTFEGMTEPSNLDVEIESKKTAKSLLEKEKKIELANGNYNTWCVADLNDVKEGFSSLCKLSTDKVKFIEGNVLNTVPKYLPEKIAICRIDTDWYESTAHLLHECWERIQPGGVLILDDYDYWEGARIATNEFFESHNLKPLLIRLDSGRVVIKLE